MSLGARAGEGRLGLSGCFAEYEYEQERDYEYEHEIDYEHEHGSV